MLLLGAVISLIGYYDYSPCLCPNTQAPCQCSGSGIELFVQAGLLLAAAGILVVFSAQFGKSQR